MSCESVRTRIRQLHNDRPFRRFLITLESGDRVLIEHPENISFDPEGQRDDLYVITGRVRLFSTFSAVSSLELADQDSAAA